MTRPTPPKPWKPGESGNPNGRPKGTGEVAKLREQIARHVPAIIRALVKQAKNGDAAAARLLLERAVPALKAAEHLVPMALPEGTLTQQGRAVLAAAAAGAIPPGQATEMLASLSALSNLTATDELAARLAALEQRLGRT